MQRRFLGCGTSFMGACKLYKAALVFFTLKCKMHSIHNMWLQLIFTAARSRNRITITNRIFAPRRITSFQEWTATRQPAGRITAKIHHLEQVRTVLKWYFWVVEICQESTVAPLIYRLTAWALQAVNCSIHRRSSSIRSDWLSRISEFSHLRIVENLWPVSAEGHCRDMGVSWVTNHCDSVCFVFQ